MAQFTGVAYTYNGSATSNYTYFVDYTYTQNVNTNQSTITAKTYLRSKGSGVSTVSSQWKSIINGTQVWSGSATVSGNNVSFGTKTWTVNHNSDGTGRTEIHASFSNGIAFQDSYVVKSGKLDVAINLPTIPRTSSFSLNTTSPTLGQTSVVVTINRASSSFTHKVRLDYGKTSTVLSSNAGTSYTFTPSLNLASETPSATSGVGNLVVQTYNGSTYIGESVRQITMNIPSTVVPTFTSIAIKGNNLLGGYYVAGKSTATITLGGAGGTYGSSVNGYEIKSNVGNYNSSSSSYTTPTLGATDSLTFTGRVKDTRNRWSSTRTTSPAVKVYSYRVPTVSLSIVRTDETGTPSDEGVYAKIDINYNIDPIVSGTTINAKKYTVNWREVGGDWVNWNINDVSLPNYSGTIQAPFVTGWAINKSYEVRVILSDSFTTLTSTGTIPTGFCILDIEEIGIGVGKYHQKGALDIQGDVYTTNNFIGKFKGKSFIPPQTGRTQSLGDMYCYNTSSGASSTGAPTTYTSTIGFGAGASGTVEISGGWGSSNGGLWYRQLRDYQDNWYSWKRIYTTDYKPSLSDIGARSDLAPQSGAWFKGTPIISNDGVLEIGKYIDFHETTTGTSDYTVRLQTEFNYLYSDTGYMSRRNGNNFIARQTGSTNPMGMALQSSDATTRVIFYTPNQNYNAHIRSVSGGVVLRGTQTYVKSSDDSVYAQINASKFNVASEMKWKKDVIKYEKKAKDIIKSNLIYQYSDKSDEKNKKRIGLIIDKNTPLEIVSIGEYRDDRTDEEKKQNLKTGIQEEDKYIDLYAMTSLSWKAIQELSDENELLKKQITQLQADLMNIKKHLKI